MKRIQYYFFQLETGRFDLKEKNDYVYKQILLYGQKDIYGWSLKGKAGTLDKAASFLDRRGLITEYVVQYLSTDGQWKYIKNPKTSKKIFTSKGNTATPTEETVVTLDSPIKTIVLRIYPQLWDGLPYLDITLHYCKRNKVQKTTSKQTSKVAKPKAPKKEFENLLEANDSRNEGRKEAVTGTKTVTNTLEDRIEGALKESDIFKKKQKPIKINKTKLENLLEAKDARQEGNKEYFEI